MNVTPEDQELKTAAAVNQAIVELLVNPEYGMDFITEIREGNGSWASDEQIDDRVMAQLNELAKPFIAALPDEVRRHYIKDKG